MVEANDGGIEGPTDQALRALVREERHRSEVEARRRRRELHRQAMESVSLMDVLGSLAGSGAPALVHTRQGERPPSTVIELGRDYAALRARERETSLVPVAAIVAVRPVIAMADPLSAPRPAADPGLVLSLQDRLAELALRRPRVTVRASGAVVVGRLSRVGLDLLVVTGDDGTDAFVPLAGLDELEV